MAHRTALIARTLFIVGLSAWWLYSGREEGKEFGPAAAESALYGVRDVDSFELSPGRSGRRS